MRSDGRLGARARVVIRLALSRHKRTEEELAADVGVNPATVSRWLKQKGGGLALSTFQRLCNTLGVTPNQLLLDDDQEERDLINWQAALEILQDAQIEIVQRRMRGRPQSGGSPPRGKLPPAR